MVVKRAQDGLGSMRGRHDESGDGAEAEEHHIRAVIRGRVAEGAMGE
jgi:hypothetical protein